MPRRDRPGVVPRANSRANVRIPDLAITRIANQPGERVLPDPVVVIEILSPSNEAETRDNVWAYLSIPTVRHILLVRSTEVLAELLTRDADGNWPAAPLLLGPADRIVLSAIGYEGALAAFFADTHLARRTDA